MKPKGIKIRKPCDNYGRVYVSMLESKLSTHAKLCYGVMWSFGGSDSWAAVERIAERMSASENTVRKAQKELQEAGWIKMVEKSVGRKSNTWEMMTPETEPTLQAVNPNPSGGEVLTLQEVNPKKEENKEVNQETSKDIPPTEAIGSATPPKVKTPEPYLEIIRASWLKAGLILVEPGWPIRTKVAKQGALVGEVVFQKIVNDYLAFFGPGSKEGPSIGGFILYKFEGLANKYMAQKKAMSAEVNERLKYILGR